MEYQFKVGILATIFSAFVEPCCAIIIKKVQKHNTHFSIVNSYASYFGIPTTLMLISLVTASGQSTTDYSQMSTNNKFYESLFISIASALLDITAQVIWIISVKFDDVSKIAMYRASDLLFTFIVQYIFKVKNVRINELKYIGAVFITCAMVLVMGFKLIDAERQKRIELDRKLGITVRKAGFFERFVFFKV